MSRHRSSVGLRWPSKRIAALHRLPIRLVLAARCALRCAPMAARSLRHLIRDATLALTFALAMLTAPSARAHGPTPQKIDEAVEIAAAPAAVWALVGDFGSLARWNPRLKASEADQGNAVGSKRSLTFDQGAGISEELDEHLPAEMSMSYRSGRTIDTKVLAVGSYSARLRVVPAGSGSRLEWRARAYRADTGNEPATGLDDAAAVQALRDFMLPALHAAKKKLEDKQN
ncbi:SRPBCC family protein [Verminephrobacter eiseniae]|uniref:SRPBCC family protein n=1 Tax=Verminephrobacter eiseniae TaxID=364317 RepID=UPI0022378FBE|nr:SRPBCC family protein [Verminephrobacter eiseniae]